VADRGCLCGNIESKYSFTKDKERREWLTVGVFVVR
jgi:hypothetical protein